MSTADVVVMVAAGVGSLGAIVSLAAAFVLVSQVRRLERGIEALRHEAVPLVEEAHAAAGHAATEIARVDAVLADTEAVTAAVEQAARMARRAFANPVVKVLAWRAGAVGGLRRLRSPHVRTDRRGGPGGTDRRGGSGGTDRRGGSDGQDGHAGTGGKGDRARRDHRQGALGHVRGPERVESVEVVPAPPSRHPVVGPRR